MVDAPNATVHEYPDREALSHGAATALVTDIHDVLRRQDRYTLALAGGSTPRRLYELLGNEEEGALPWNRLHLFWGDERYLPHTHPDSNVHMVREMLLNAAPIPDDNVHPMPTQGNSAAADAATYASTLQAFFNDRTDTFDTVLLGLGSDGHTASLFPETSNLGDTDQWVRVVEAPPRHDVSTRLTCTLPVLNGTRQAFVLVSGSQKQDALRGVLKERDPSLPGTHVDPQGHCYWYVDHAAWPTSEQ